MVDIDSIQDLICNIKDAMKDVFMPRDELNTTYSKTNHTHTVDTALSSTSTNPVQNKVINTALSGKANTSHNHTLNDVTGLTSALSDKADSNHTHDNRYYTESEMDTKLNGKSNTDHNHDSRYYTETEVDTKLNGKSNTGHTHDDRYFTETEVTNKLALKSDKTHNHQGVYPEINDFNALAAKFNKTDAIRVRLIRANSNYTPFPQDTEVENEGTILEVMNGYKLGARLYSTDPTISLNGRNVTLIMVASNGWPTMKQTTTNNQGITREMINLGNNLDGVAYAILKGTSTYNKSTDIKFVQYQS